MIIDVFYPCSLGLSFHSRRSTVIPRDLLVERLIHGWSFNYSDMEKAELARMVAVGVITEVILENTSVLVSPFLMYRMFEEPLFMSVVGDRETISTHTSIDRLLPGWQMCTRYTAHCFNK